MRTRYFEVPVEIIGDFFTKADAAKLEIELVEVNQDEELVVKVEYDDEE